MPQPKPEDLSDDERRARRLRDPQEREIIRQIKGEPSQEERSAGDDVSAEELPGFLRDLE